MKYAISTEGNQVSGHFGRAPQFTFVTIEDGELKSKEVLSNPGHTVGSIPQFVNAQGAECMIAGGMGRRAVDFFTQYGINVVMGIQGTIDEVIQKIINNELESGESLCSPGAGKGYGVEKIHTEADDDHEAHH
ncbi:MAG: dinitrogenase iron-molybdenum cofactor [Candidatus Lokiarchaeota archaeon]|nr:dinitrogenase iron-molybdenum cofactor [Candidatus Lokiarchaeota archaeon]MBD3201293.1 dinitrogenase iron-molybdenum cofactor [Candidatus Lokiarchaeota archaeon]